MLTAILMISLMIAPQSVSADPEEWGWEPEYYIYERVIDEETNKESCIVTAWSGMTVIWTYASKEYEKYDGGYDARQPRTVGLGVTDAGFLLLTGDGVECLDKNTGALKGTAFYDKIPGRWFIADDDTLYLAGYNGDVTEIDNEGNVLRITSTGSSWPNSMICSDGENFRIHYTNYGKPRVATVNRVTMEKTSDVDAYGPIYKDVSRVTDWFSDAVESMYSHGYMTGMTNELFGPAEKLSRAQFATILYRIESDLLHRYPSGDGLNSFPDVPDDSWYTNPAIWANLRGIITGYKDGRFAPADDITREQIVTILFRFAQYHNLEAGAVSDLSAYPDADKVSDWARDAMEWAIANKIMSGKDGGKYLDPQGTASRAECAQFILNFINQFRDLFDCYHNRVIRVDA